MSGLIKPQQDRSRDKLRRIMAATETLLRRQTFDDLSISDIVQQAGVSIGTFYNRFRSKEALLQCLLDDYWEQDRVERHNCLAAMKGQCDLKQRSATMTDYFVRDYLAHAGVLRTITLRWRLQFARVSGQAEHRSTVASVLEMAEALRGGRKDLHTEQAVFCVHVVTNICRDFCLFPELLADATLPEWRDQVRDYLAAACRGVLTGTSFEHR